VATHRTSPATVAGDNRGDDMHMYLLTFRGQPDREPPAGAEEKWGAWFAELGSSVANPGSRVGETVTVAPDDPGDPATAVVTGFMTVTADSLDAAADLARGCPGLADGIAVEVGHLVEM
jgi:hypothetical protein